MYLLKLFTKRKENNIVNNVLAISVFKSSESEHTQTLLARLMQERLCSGQADHKATVRAALEMLRKYEHCWGATTCHYCHGMQGDIPLPLLDSYSYKE